jgi:hypothetical protein
MACLDSNDVSTLPNHFTASVSHTPDHHFDIDPFRKRQAQPELWAGSGQSSLKGDAPSERSGRDPWQALCSAEIAETQAFQHLSLARHETHVAVKDYHSAHKDLEEARAVFQEAHQQLLWARKAQMNANHLARYGLRVAVISIALSLIAAVWLTWSLTRSGYVLACAIALSFLLVYLISFATNVLRLPNSPSEERDDCQPQSDSIEPINQL